MCFGHNKDSVASTYALLENIHISSYLPNLLLASQYDEQYMISNHALEAVGYLFCNYQLICKELGRIYESILILISVIYLDLFRF